MKILLTGKAQKLLALSLAAVLILAAGLWGLLLWRPHSRPASSGSVSSPPRQTAPVYPTPSKLLSVSVPEGLSLPAIASGEYFYVQRNGRWECIFLKGVNIGLTLPTTDLNNPDIPYSTYLLWFEQIAAMNANTIRVFTIMNPDFYSALYDYNQRHPEDPLYLLHGLWFNENDMNAESDAFGENEKILRALERAAREAADIIHGNSDYTSYGTLSPAIYDKDVSPYVLGWILGLEWLPEFVENTNRRFPGQAEYSGKYLQTKNAGAFEGFLARAGDYAIGYETETYAAQRPVAFLSWQTTDPLSQSNEPFPEEDLVQVRTEAIVATPDYHAGLFAAMDIYPYYPEFMNYQPEYLKVTGGDDKPNPYRGYLRALKQYYSVPVVVAEVGLSTSRGVAHRSVMGYDQGGLEESKQGELVLNMIQDIAQESYAGAMIFSWQDEWFKQTWNTYRYAPRNAAARPFNAQSAEQHYGILAYEPGADAPACYPDGDLSEWANRTPVCSDSRMTLFAAYDEGYFYLMGRASEQFDLTKNTLLIPISVTDLGSTRILSYDVEFSKPADFLLVLAGKYQTRLLTEATRDYFYYEYAHRRGVFPSNSRYLSKNSGIFNPTLMFTSNEIVLPLTKEVIPPASFETGLFKFGNANPAGENYSSLADFWFDRGAFEVRIPWQLLNVVSPAEGLAMGDFYSGGSAVRLISFQSFAIGAGVPGQKQPVSMAPVPMSGWKQSTYHARLKKSYTVLQKGLAKVMPDYQ